MAERSDKRSRAGMVPQSEHDIKTIPAEWVFKRWDWFIFSVLTILNSLVILAFCFYWSSLKEDWLRHPIILSTLGFGFAFLLLNNQGRWFMLPSMRKPKPIPARAGWKVAVATTFVPSGESIEMLERTVEALVGLDYCHDTWVLDEEDDNDVKALCARLGANYFTRALRAEYQAEDGLFKSRSKHGNYNAWLDAIGFNQYEIITIFDPDHIPRSSYLSEVLGYFSCSNIAYVQSAQAYYNQQASFIARGAAEETYAYYSTIQMASYGMGYPVIVGSHNSHRVRALKEVGGFPCHDAEDILLTLNYRLRGWQGVYVPKILARGLTPVDWSGYLNQQRRWARSILDIKWRMFPTLSRMRLPFRARLVSFMHGVAYVYRSVFIFILLVTGIFIVGSASFVELSSISTLWRLAGVCGILELCEFYRQRYFLDPGTERGLHWRAAVVHFAKWPFQLWALYDVVSGRHESYQLTPKRAVGKKRPVLFWPNLLVASSFAGALIFRLFFGGPLQLIIGLMAGAVVTACLSLMWTEWLEFGPPYNPDLYNADSFGGARVETDAQLKRGSVSAQS